MARDERDTIMSERKTPNFTDAHRGRYRTAEDSRKPGYLAQRFKDIRAQQERERQESQANVTSLTKRTARR